MKWTQIPQSGRTGPIPVLNFRQCRTFVLRADLAEDQSLTRSWTLTTRERVRSPWEQNEPKTPAALGLPKRTQGPELDAPTVDKTNPIARRSAAKRTVMARVRATGGSPEARPQPPTDKTNPMLPTKRTQFPLTKRTQRRSTKRTQCPNETNPMPVSDAEAVGG
jgi:hypothetical protein